MSSVADNNKIESVASSLSTFQNTQTTANLNPNRGGNDDDLTAHKTHHADQQQVDCGATINANAAAALKKPQNPDEYYVDLIPDYELVCNKSLVNNDLQRGILGRGGCGDVYLARRRSDGTYWAVKCVEGHRIDMRDIECQRREFELFSLARVQHPNLIRIEGFYVDVDFSPSKSEHRSKNNIPELKNKRYCMVQEVIPGGHTLLNELLDEPFFDKGQRYARFQESKAHKIFTQLVMGLMALHQAGVAHRDMKPENVMYDRRTNKAKITDFGFAMFFMPGDINVSDRGTLEYADPCVILANRQRNIGYSAPLADIWGLGVILYMMLIGYRPYPNNAVDDKKRDIFGVSPAKEILEKMPAAANLVAQMLMFDPSQRITLHGILDHPWFRKNFDKANLLFFHPVMAGERNKYIETSLTRHLEVAKAAQEKKVKDGKSHDLEDRDVEYREHVLKEFSNNVNSAKQAAEENEEELKKLMSELADEEVAAKQVYLQHKQVANEPLENNLHKFDIPPLTPAEHTFVNDQLGKSIAKNFDQPNPSKAVLLEFLGLSSIEQLRNLLYGAGGIVERIYPDTGVIIDASDVSTPTANRECVNAYHSRTAAASSSSTKEQLEAVVMMSLETVVMTSSSGKPHFVLKVKKSAGNVHHLKNFVYHLVTFNPNLCRHVKFMI